MGADNGGNMKNSRNMTALNRYVTNRILPYTNTALCKELLFFIMPSRFTCQSVVPFYISSQYMQTTVIYTSVDIIDSERR